MVITIIVGSPCDKGSSSRIADRIIDGFFRDDCFSGTINKHCLGNINIQYCKGCKSCYVNGKCVISDDFQMVFDHIIESDGLVIISPSYWGDITGQLKVFFDRSTPFCDTNPHRQYPEKKRMGMSVAIRTGMNEAENRHIIDTIEHYFGHLAIEPIDRLSVCGVETPSDLMKHKDALDRAFKLGANMRAHLEREARARITVRKGSEDDIKDVFDIYTEAIDWLDSQGIHQWQHGIYPTEDTAHLAFDNDSLFVVEERGTGTPIGTMIKAQRLKKGDTIGIIAPCFAYREESIAKALQELQKMGFEVKLGQNAYKDSYGFAASPEERAADFNAMVSDQSVRMVLFGGGEVGNEILPLIDYSAVKANPKIYCSYSDGTTILNALFAMSEMVTYHGLSLKTFEHGSKYNMRSIEDRLMNPSAQYSSADKWRVLRDGRCKGILVGGYLPNFALMLNSAYFQYEKSKSYILFLEENQMFNGPAVVSKYLSHIAQSGFLDHVCGLIFGHYALSDPEEIYEILRRLGQKYNIPVIKCDDFGHGANNAILPIGILAELDTFQSQLTFLEDTVS